MLIIPAIDLKDGKCVRLKQGRMEDDTVFSDDPVATAQHWVNEGARRLHLVDLNGAFAGTPIHKPVVEAIAKAQPELPIQIGGGIRSLETIEHYLDAGVSFVIIGTKAVQNPEFVEEACQKFAGHIIVGIDAMNGMVATDGWANVTDVKATDLAKRFADAGVSSIVYTDIARDGMMQGVNVEQTVNLAQYSGLPVIASGGVTNLDDVRNLKGQPGCRFAAATIAVGLLSYKYLRGIHLKEIIAGALIGSMIAGGYGSQTVGMQTISSSESAFLTALYVPLVPILIWLIFRKRPHVMTWLGVLLAFIGLIFLTGNGFNQINLNTGQIEPLLERLNPFQQLTVIQLAFASVLSFASMPFVGEHHIPAFSWELLILAVGLGLTSSILQLTMNWAQRSVDPSQAAVIYAGEPVWAALFGRIAGERLPLVALFGGLLVVLGIILSEWRPRFLNRKQHQKSTHTI
ncbi:hypothetical protein FQR65_LT15526 [Abscondita terminalis]|nr:hypothetical protein FQR65_LT15526 [Abscondita terminalis]